MDRRLKSRGPGLFCKLDMKKVYDHVNWKFLLYLLARCDFGEKWLNWVEFCISTFRFSILVNGSSVGFFDSSHDLWQRVLLTPLLFLFVMETFSKMIECLVEGWLSIWVLGGVIMALLKFLNCFLLMIFLSFVEQILGITNLWRLYFFVSKPSWVRELISQIRIGTGGDCLRSDHCNLSIGM